MRVTVLAFAGCALACVVAHIAILTSVVRRSAKALDSNVPRLRPFVEVLWALIPALVLAFVLTATWDRVRDGARPKPHEILRVAR